MPGLKGRLSTVVKSKISKQLDRAEKPDETLDYAYQRQLEDLQNVKKGIADLLTAKKGLEHQKQQLQGQADTLATQAREAMSAGREDLAREALQRKQLISGQADSLDQQVVALQSEQEKLIQSESQLQTKIEQFRSKKEVIKAQYSAAEAQVHVSEAATGVGDSMADVGMATQRALDKTETMKARASATEELEAAGTFGDLTALGPAQDHVDRELDQLGAQSAVDEEFARLKAEVDSGTSQSALPPGQEASGGERAADGGTEPKP
jgi:phage shock protein A